MELASGFSTGAIDPFAGYNTAAGSTNQTNNFLAQQQYQNALNSSYDPFAQSGGFGRMTDAYSAAGAAYGRATGGFGGYGGNNDIAGQVGAGQDSSIAPWGSQPMGSGYVDPSTDTSWFSRLDPTASDRMAGFGDSGTVMPWPGPSSKGPSSWQIPAGPQPGDTSMSPFFQGVRDYFNPNPTNNSESLTPSGGWDSPYDPVQARLDAMRGLSPSMYPSGGGGSSWQIPAGPQPGDTSMSPFFDGLRTGIQGIGGAGPLGGVYDTPNVGPGYADPSTDTNWFQRLMGGGGGGGASFDDRWSAAPPIDYRMQPVQQQQLPQGIFDGTFTAPSNGASSFGNRFWQDPNADTPMYTPQDFPGWTPPQQQSSWDNPYDPVQARLNAMRGINSQGAMGGGSNPFNNATAGPMANTTDMSMYGYPASGGVGRQSDYPGLPGWNDLSVGQDSGTAGWGRDAITSALMGGGGYVDPSTDSNWFQRMFGNQGQQGVTDPMGSSISQPYGTQGTGGPSNADMDRMGYFQGQQNFNELMGNRFNATGMPPMADGSLAANDAGIAEAQRLKDLYDNLMFDPNFRYDPQTRPVGMPGSTLQQGDTQGGGYYAGG